MTFSVDKSVSALWAIAEPQMRERIEAMATAAARAALEDSVLKHCSYTRLAEKGVTRPVEADLMGATFVHGTSRENDPQLHVHCTIFNVARTREDGKWRAHHQYPVYSWKKAAGALFRANLAWELQQGLGVRMEQYGPNNEFTRIAGMPDDLKAFWSKRRKAIVAMAGELGIPSLGNASRMAGVNKITREGKSHDNDPEVRHRRWRGEAEGFVEREELIASVTGHEVEIGREAIRELTDRLDELPAHLAREEAVFRRPDMVEAAANAAAGLMGREAVGTAIERLRRNPEIERLEPKKPTAESKAGMVHTEVYSTRHNLGLEQAVRDMAEAMAVDTGHALPEEAVKEKVETLLAEGYPLSQEQSLAIRHATIRGGRVAVIEGAAGSGKTTTLQAHHRPAQGARLRDRADGGGLADRGGAGRRLRCARLLRRQAAEARREGAGRDRPQHADRGGRGGDAVDPPGTPHSPALRAPRRQGGVRRRHAAAAARGGGAGVEARP